MATTTPPPTTLWISIVSYRDSETVPTIISLFSQCSNCPFLRIRVVVVWQLDFSSEIDKSYLFPPSHSLLSSPNLIQIFISHTLARGPIYARALAQQSIREFPLGENDIFLQLDSHHRMVKHWDLISYYSLRYAQKISGKHKIVLTSYPPPYELTEKYNNNKDISASSASSSPTSISLSPSSTSLSLPVILCASHFHDHDGLIRVVGKQLANPIISFLSHSSSSSPTYQNDQKNNHNSLIYDNDIHHWSHLTFPLLPSLFLAAGCFLSPISSIVDSLLCISSNVHLPAVFNGEEILMAIRLYSNGYSFYALPTQICQHLWKRNYRNTFDELMDKGEGKGEMLREGKGKAIEKIKMFIEGKESNDMKLPLCSSCDPFGMGSVHSLQDFITYCGVNFRDKSISEEAKWGGVNRSLYQFKEEKQEKNMEQIMKLLTGKKLI